MNDHEKLTNIKTCFNCKHWQDTYPDQQRARRTVLWDGVEPDWSEKSCEIDHVEKSWSNISAVGVLINKYQNGSVPEVKEAIAYQCSQYVFSPDHLSKP